MPSQFPSLTPTRIVRALKKAGFVEDRQKGSHLILINSKTHARTVVPIHKGKTLKMPLVRAIILDAKLSVAEFRGLL
jgi:predicted RNA binding protein YcfA (HicA-like mRNA interferase family)